MTVATFRPYTLPSKCLAHQIKDFINSRTPKQLINLDNKQIYEEFSEEVDEKPKARKAQIRQIFTNWKRKNATKCSYLQLQPSKGANYTAQKKQKLQLEILSDQQIDASAPKTPLNVTPPPKGTTSPPEGGGSLTHSLSSLSGNIPTGSKTYIDEIVAIQAEFKKYDLQCSVRDAEGLRDRALQMSGGEELPPWSIPPLIEEKKGKNLYDPHTYVKIIDHTEWPNANPGLVAKGITKQVLIMKCICDTSIEIVAVEADKRKGKSTCAFGGICQGTWEGIFKNIGLWASGEDNAIGILSDVFRDEISVNQTLPLFKGTGSQKQKVFFNNAIIKAFSNNAARTSGLDFDLTWIDEAHEVVVEHPEVFDMIIMTMRAKPTIKLLITMNKGTGTYNIFKNTLEKEFGKEVVFFTIEDGDITHITRKADKKVRTLVKAVGGKKEVARWLDNKTVNLSTFDSMSVLYAYENYELFLNTHKPIAAYTVASYDPSGTGHPMGFSIWSCDQTGSYFWQRFGIEYELGERPEEWGLGEKLSHRQIQASMFEESHRYRITHFIAESNMDGKATMIEFRGRGYTAENQNFGNDKNKDGTPSRGAMCHIVRRIMDNQALFINSERLRDQWSIYNPDQHDKVAKFKGDEADSGIHGIYYLCTLTNSPYLSQHNYEMEWI